jgi:hypothetical protein
VTVRVHVDTSADRMRQQTIKQLAKCTAREGRRAAARARGARASGDRPGRAGHGRAIGGRDAAVAEPEKRAGEALRELTERADLSRGKAVEWSCEAITVREATRLRRLASERANDSDAGRMATVRRRWPPRGVGERVPRRSGCRRRRIGERRRRC